MKQKSLSGSIAQKTLVLAAMLLFLAVLPACGLLRQPVQKPAGSPPTAQVTADEIARAMQEDHFFSDYRLTTLVVQGTVASVDHQGKDRVVTLGTSIPTHVLCDLGVQPYNGKKGDAITVQSPSSGAERAPSAVLLKNCQIVSH
jgi:hypothetical protein